MSLSTVHLYVHTQLVTLWCCQEACSTNLIILALINVVLLTDQSSLFTSALSVSLHQDNSYLSSKYMVCLHQFFWFVPYFNPRYFKEALRNLAWKINNLLLYLSILDHACLCRVIMLCVELHLQLNQVSSPKLFFNYIEITCLHFTMYFCSSQWLKKKR